ncbi:uncharacterized protein LOC119433285 [Dermacentor silvarum]|uniref:uncharacterized protein LOC119433285 n=1 Tax=Dermacentor silvarum TaxID=543639 RepID=UPI002100CC82|nr:uncharacterized protein LOC119433285 [Dermacentor silvarum]
MLADGALIIVLFFISHSEALSFLNLKITPIDGVTTLGEECFYQNEKFRLTWNVSDKCERRTCYADSKVVVVTKCGDIPEGCYLSSKERQPLPLCCNTTCNIKTYMCLTRDGRLLKNGDELNLRDPCVRYICKNGILVTQTCQTYTDPKCSASQVDKCAPYPACCGVAKVCAG